MTEQEIATFVDLFYRDGYILNFYDVNKFNIFTQKSIGIPLCEKYQRTIPEALTSFLSNDATPAEKETLLCDLLSYYEEQSCYKGERDCEDLFGDGSYVLRDMEHGAKYDVCKQIADRLRKSSNPTKDSAEHLKKEFSDTYLVQQIELMEKEVEENPLAAIGSAKELIETCCKTILDNTLSVRRDPNWSVDKLFYASSKQLNLIPDDVTSPKKAKEIIDKVLNNLKNLALSLAELRNYYGKGHGKTASYVGLEVHHARLAVNSSITLVRFLWDTYKEGKKGEI